MVRTSRPRPVDLVSPWPRGETSDEAGATAAASAVRLSEVIGERSIRSVAVLCGINHQMLHAALAGEVWPDMYTTARLEHGLESSLWPAQ